MTFAIAAARHAAPHFVRSSCGFKSTKSCDRMSHCAAVRLSQGASRCYEHQNFPEPILVFQAGIGRCLLRNPIRGAAIANSALVMRHLTGRRTIIISILSLVMTFTSSGCGTTVWTDTPRTATEQLLISTAIDEAVEGIDFAPFSHKEVFLDTTYLDDSVDHEYLKSCLRARMRSQGCVLRENASDAVYVVEARAGAVGTDRHESLIGIPATSVDIPTTQMGAPANIPEIALAKTTQQRGVAKIACFAYRRESGQAYWQSGVVPVSIIAKKTWVLGVGSFKRGSLYERTRFVEAGGFGSPSEKSRLSKSAGTSRRSSESQSEGLLR
jgi:hypothetical protein